MRNDFNVVARRVIYEGGIVIGVVVSANSRLAIVFATSLDGCGMERINRSLIYGVSLVAVVQLKIGILIATFGREGMV